MGAPNHTVAGERQDRFLRLYLPEHDRLARFARAMTRDRDEARDLVGDTLLAAYEHFDELADPQAFVSWIYTFNSSTGETKARYVYTDLFRTSTGAILSSMVYPNPAVNNISVRFNLGDARGVKISLFDIEGRLLRDLTPAAQQSAKGESTISTTIGNVPPGMYLLGLITDHGEQAVQRLIIVDRH